MSIKFEAHAVVVWAVGGARRAHVGLTSAEEESRFACSDP